MSPTSISHIWKFSLLFFLSVLGMGARAVPKPYPLARLEVNPRRVVLQGREARQQVRVTGYLPDGTAIDLTRRAEYSLTKPQTARFDSSNFTLLPLADGDTTLQVRFGSLKTQLSIQITNYKSPFRWSFENHIEPVLTRLGCNMGICHGGASGKGGFKLSLRAYDPEKDYERIRFEGKGRRVNSANPEKSLLLLKPTLAVAHSGGLRLKANTLEYRVLKEWIAAGAAPPYPQTPRIERVEVFPKERVLLPQGDQKLLVTAHFSDGHTEDVTHWAKFASNDEQIAQVDAEGQVRLLTQGEATINVWYMGQVGYARLRVPFANPIPNRLPRANLIDDAINQKLIQLRLTPSERSSDAMFLRRVMLDVIGVLPTPDELASFLKDTAPNRRERLIDSLLKRPEYADYWTYRWSDLFRLNRNTLGNTGLEKFHAYIKTAVAENRAWDKFCAEILTASGSHKQNGAANFYRIGSSPEEYAENVTQAFLGIRLQCAHCHNHPHEKWTQADYYRMASLFARVEVKRINPKKDDPDPEESIGVNQKGEVSHPRLGKPQPPAPLGSTALLASDTQDRRVAFAKWLTEPKNPFFARSFVNRVWKYLMGQGMFEPADDLRATNPATNELLLESLSRWFVQNGYNMRELIRLIVLSEAYQRSSRLLPQNRQDDRYYARYLPRRLPAETLLDAIGQVTGKTETFGGNSAKRTYTLLDTNAPSAFLDLFGRPLRQITCECERMSQTSVSQTLHLLNAPTLNSRIQAQGGRLEQILKQNPSEKEALSQLYLLCLSREPTAKEQEQVLLALKPCKTETDRFALYADLFWAVLSGKEFLFNH